MKSNATPKTENNTTTGHTLDVTQSNFDKKIRQKIMFESFCYLTALLTHDIEVLQKNKKEQGEGFSSEDEGKLLQSIERKEVFESIFKDMLEHASYAQAYPTDFCFS